MAKLFEENYQKDNVIYPFHPDVTSKNLNHVFYSDNFCKEQADNDSNKIFLFRLMKAREEKEFKKNCLENNVNKKLEINWSCPKKLKRSVSQKDSLLIKRTLHNNLLSLKCLETHNTNEENNNDMDKELESIQINQIPYYFGSHYSNPTYVSHYLTRIFPYSFVSIEIQGDKFDDPDRMFISVEKTFESACTLKDDVRELIPEFYTLPEIFQNEGRFH